MGEFAKWLLDDEQKEVFQFFFASVLTLFFLALLALLLWPAGKAAMALSLAKGFWIFWLLLAATGGALAFLQRLFRVDIDSHFDAYVISALALSGFLQAGWSAFAAVVVKDFAAGAPLWLASLLYLAGVLSCWVAHAAVSAYYPGSIYRLVNLSLALLGFAVFSVWPAAGRAAYAWFFHLWGRLGESL